MSVGTVTTGAAGSSASVTNSGTSGAAVFDFVIPKGDPGTAEIADGDKGDITTADSGDTWTLNDGVVGAGNLAPGIFADQATVEAGEDEDQPVNSLGAAQAISAQVYPTRADLLARDPPAVQLQVRTGGYALAGDGGGADYRSVGSEPSHPGKFQSPDGRWWELSSPFVNLLNFGAVGDDIADDTAAVQAAATYSDLTGKAIYVPTTDAAYRVTAPIVSERGAKFIGEGVDPYYQRINPVSIRGRGSWFHIDHAGKGFVWQTDDAGMVTTGGGITGCGTVRNQPTPGAGAFTPNDLDFDVFSNGADLRLHDVCLLNPSRGVQTISGRLICNAVYGQPLITGIEVVRSYDVCRLSDIHWWPYWSHQQSVWDWTTINADGILSRRNDNPYMFNLFSIFMRSTLRIGWYEGAGETYPAGTTYKGKVVTIDGDVGQSVILVDDDVVSMTLDAINVSAQGTARLVEELAGEVVFHNIHIQGENNNLGLDNVRLHAANASNIRVDGTGNTVNVGTIINGTYNVLDGGYESLHASSGNEIRLDGRWGRGSGGTAAKTSGTVRAQLGRGRVTGQMTDGSGQLTFNHGLGVAPTDVFFEIRGGGTGATVFFNSATDTTVTVTLFNAAGSGTINNTAVSFSWLAFLN
jgi:hypothetical protein